MTPLRQRTVEELERRSHSQATVESYVLAVKDFAEYFGKSPDLLGAEEVRRYSPRSDLRLAGSSQAT